MIRTVILIIVFAFCNGLKSQHVLLTQQEKTKLFQWQENRLKILVEGHLCQEIVVTASAGEIVMDSDNCEIIYTASDTGIHRTKIRIGIKQEAGIDWIQESELPVFSAPDPIPTIRGRISEDSITRLEFLVEDQITVPVNVMGWHMWQLDSKQKITRYSVKITRKDSVVFSRVNIEGNMFPVGLKEFVQSSVIKNDEISFYDIETLIYTKEARHLPEQYKLIFY